MIRVALTGGIGSGKSTVARLLRERGCVVLDADQLAREAVEPGSPALSEIASEFGPSVLTEAGRLDRAALGDIVFGDPARRRRLEEIVHPRVSARLDELMLAQAPEAIVIYDVPLLAESGAQRAWDVVIVVDCPDDLRLRRLVEDRGLDEADARRRMAAQAGRGERLALADVVIDNSGSLTMLESAVAEIHQHLLLAASG